MMTLNSPVSGEGIRALLQWLVGADILRQEGHPIVPAHFLNEVLASFTRQTARPALVYRGRTVTYGEMDALSASSAAWLQGLGVGPGDRVALSSTDKLAFLAAHLGTLRA